MKSVILFASGFVGKSVLEFLTNNQNYSSILKGVVVLSEEGNPNRIPVKPFMFSKGMENELIEYVRNIKPELIILAWWPFVLKKEIIELSKRGIINFHPSLLPYNRGKNYNFWTIVEDTPFGVSLHLINEKIDLGPILYQRKIEKTWEDTGETLYFKAQNTITSLFQEKADEIFSGEWKPIVQNPKEGSFRFSKELDVASKIELDKQYTARELINLLRARTFPPHPSCYFYDNNEKYEVRIEIKKI